MSESGIKESGSEERSSFSLYTATNALDFSYSLHFPQAMYLIFTKSLESCSNFCREHTETSRVHTTRGISPKFTLTSLVWSIFDMEKTADAVEIFVLCARRYLPAGGVFSLFSTANGEFPRKCKNFPLMGQPKGIGAGSISKLLVGVFLHSALHVLQVQSYIF
jgi:hypothetical protein